MTHGIQKYKCCLGLTDAECANIPSRHCTGLAPDHGPQWVADEIRKAEKMTDKIDTSPEAVERHLDLDHNHEAGLIPMGTQIFMRALSARVAELEAQVSEDDVLIAECESVIRRQEQRAATLECQLKEAARQAISDDLSLQTALDDKRTLEERYLAVVGDKIDLRGEVATLEAKLAKAVDVDLIEQAINDVLSEGGNIRDAAEYVARATLEAINAEIQTETVGDSRLS